MEETTVLMATEENRCAKYDDYYCMNISYTELFTRFLLCIFTGTSFNKLATTSYVVHI